MAGLLGTLRPAKTSPAAETAAIPKAAAISETAFSGISTAQPSLATWTTTHSISSGLSVLPILPRHVLLLPVIEKKLPLFDFRSLVDELDPLAFILASNSRDASGKSSALLRCSSHALIGAAGCCARSRAGIR